VVSNLSRVFLKARKLIRLWLSENNLGSREDFVKYAIQLATVHGKSPKILEIGPYMSPLVAGHSVDTFDVLTHEELVSRAISEDGPSHLIPDVTWVGPEASERYIHGKYDLILSSHVVEHQIDLVGHFQNIYSLLNPGGYYAALIPDHRYCFDHFINPSTISDVLTAHYSREQNHSLKNYLEDRILTTHNMTLDHWARINGHPKYKDLSSIDISSIYEEYLKFYQTGQYIDVHAWKFTLETFTEIFEQLKTWAFHRLNFFNGYPVKNGNNEFWVILQRTD
jgi:hypothetical protein